MRSAQPVDRGFAIRRVESPELRLYGGFTFPAYLPLLTDAPANGVRAFLATRDEQPVGLVLGLRPPGETKALLLSLFVEKAERRRGAGAALLTAFETECRAAGVRQLTAVYTSGPGAAAVAALFHAQGWSEPVMRMLICRGRVSTQSLEVPWLKRLADLPGGHATIPWFATTAEQRAELAARCAAGEMGPSRLSPDQYEKDNEPAASLALLDARGAIVGWSLTHRLAPDRLRYTSVFARGGLALFCAVLDATFRRQIALCGDGSEGIFAVNREQEGMLRFCRRHLAPHLHFMRESVGTAKDLA